MKKVEVEGIRPFNGTLVTQPSIMTEEGDLILQMAFDAGAGPSDVRLRFVKQRAFRKRSAAYCTAWHIKDVYQALCEIVDSDWVKELWEAAEDGLRERWILRHFIIFSDDLGCLEVIAERVVVEEDQSDRGTAAW